MKIINFLGITELREWMLVELYKYAYDNAKDIPKNQYKMAAMSINQFPRDIEKDEDNFWFNLVTLINQGLIEMESEKRGTPITFRITATGIKHVEKELWQSKWFEDAD
jgi:hypothetical protein